MKRGPSRYALYWQLTRMRAQCEVAVPTLVPVKAGDRVKRDGRDALKLVRNYGAGGVARSRARAKQPRRINCESGIG